MRDLRKIKSKYEFKIDNSQIAFLLVGALVILVVVFALGVVVGKGLVRIQNMEAGAQLRAQVEATMPKIPDNQIVIEDTATPEPEYVRPQNADNPDEPALINILKDAPEATPTPEPGEIITYTPVPVQAPAPTPVPAKTPEPLPMPPAGGKFTIQLSSHPSKELAQQKRANYIEKGLTDVIIVSADVKGQTWYRVRTGSYATKQGALEFAGAIKARGIVAEPWVTEK